MSLFFVRAGVAVVTAGLVACQADIDLITRGDADPGGGSSGLSTSGGASGGGSSGTVSSGASGGVTGTSGRQGPSDAAGGIGSPTCSDHEAAVSVLINSNKDCETSEDCVKVGVCGTPAAESCEGSAYVHRRAVGLVNQSMTAVASCRGACSVCAMLTGGPLCKDHKCQKAPISDCSLPGALSTTACVWTAGGVAGGPAAEVIVRWRLPQECQAARHGGGRLVLPDGLRVRPIAPDADHCLAVNADGTLQFVPGERCGAELVDGFAGSVWVDVDASVPAGTYFMSIREAWIGDDSDDPRCRVRDLEGRAHSISIAPAVGAAK